MSNGRTQHFTFDLFGSDLTPYSYNDTEVYEIEYVEGKNTGTNYGNNTEGYYFSNDIGTSAVHAGVLTLGQVDSVYIKIQHSVNATGEISNEITTTTINHTNTSGSLHGNYTFVPKTQIALEPTIVNVLGNYFATNYQLGSPTHIAFDNNKERLYIANTNNSEIVSLNLITERPTSYNITTDI